MADSELSDHDIDKEIKSCKNNPIGLEEYLNELFPQLNESGRETIIKVAYWVSIADGEVDKKEEKLLIKIAKHFEISSAHLKGIIAEVNEIVSG
jgi:tellurite resistance protein